MTTDPVTNLIEAEVIVKQVLEEDTRSRNDDLWLTLQCWKKQGLRIYVDFSQLKDMFTPETLSRARRVFQNDRCILLPTDPKVLIQRRMKEAAIKQWFGAQSEMHQEWQNLKYGVK